MPVLLTGASGFVGLNLAEALLGRGREVVLFSHAPMPEAARAALATLPGAMVEEVGDVRSRSDLDRVFEEHRPDRVVHGAAITPGPGRERPDAHATVEVNVLGTVSVLEAAARHGPIGRLLHLSSGAVYGRAGYEVTRLEEETPAQPDATYAISKLAGEQLALRLGPLLGQDPIVARLGSVFGPWERETGVRETLSPILQVTELALLGEAAVLPRPGRRDWVYSRDVAAALVALLDAPAPRHRLYNVSGGLEWTLEAWCAKLAQAFPGFDYRLAAPGITPNVDLWSAADRAPLAIDRLLDELDHRPRFALDQAFEDYMRWLAERDERAVARHQTRAG